MSCSLETRWQIQLPANFGSESLEFSEQQISIKCRSVSGAEHDGVLSGSEPESVVGENSGTIGQILIELGVGLGCSGGGT